MSGSGRGPSGVLQESDFMVDTSGGQAMQDAASVGKQAIPRRETFDWIWGLGWFGYSTSQPTRIGKWNFHPNMLKAESEIARPIIARVCRVTSGLRGRNPLRWSNFSRFDLFGPSKYCRTKDITIMFLGGVNEQIESDTPSAFGG